MSCLVNSKIKYASKEYIIETLKRMNIKYEEENKGKTIILPTYNTKYYKAQFVMDNHGKYSFSYDSDKNYGGKWDESLTEKFDEIYKEVDTEYYERTIKDIYDRAYSMGYTVEEYKDGDKTKLRLCK